MGIAQLIELFGLKFSGQNFETPKHPRMFVRYLLFKDRNLGMVDEALSPPPPSS